MGYDLQIIVDLVVSFLTVAFPIALIFQLGAKFTSIILGFIIGKNEVGF